MVSSTKTSTGGLITITVPPILYIVIVVCIIVSSIPTSFGYHSSNRNYYCFMRPTTHHFRLQQQYLNYFGTTTTRSHLDRALLAAVRDNDNDERPSDETTRRRKNNEKTYQQRQQEEPIQVVNGDSSNMNSKSNNKSEERTNGESRQQRKLQQRRLYDVHVDFDCESDIFDDEDDVSAKGSSKKKQRCADYPAFGYEEDSLIKTTRRNDKTNEKRSNRSNEKKDKKVFNSLDSRSSKKTTTTTNSKDGKQQERVVTTAAQLRGINTANNSKKVINVRSGGGGTGRSMLSTQQKWLMRVVGYESYEPGSQNIADSIVTQTRLRLDRSYARKEPFDEANITTPPSLRDLTVPSTSSTYDGFWISTPARLLSTIVSFLSFPYITRLVDTFVRDIDMRTLDEITSKFSPGISILYGTFISLTLSILYNRQRTIQDNASIECSQLVVLTRNMLSLFRHDNDNNGYNQRAVDAGQCSADQIRTLVKSSRGAELMLLMYSDPYARMMELVDSYEDEYVLNNNNNNATSRRRRSSEGLIASCRDVIKDLYKIRAHRLSDESLALPPTHFFILNLLTLLILLGYTISIIPTMPDRTADPASESSLFFAVLFTIYLMFYNFASDLNNPFSGVYQIRRSTAASHLLQLKWLLVNHPSTNNGKIDFDEPTADTEGIVQIYSPGLGDMWFETDDVHVRDSFDDIISSRNDNSDDENMID